MHLFGAGAVIAKFQVLAHMVKELKAQLAFCVKKLYKGEMKVKVHWAVGKCKGRRGVRGQTNFPTRRGPTT